MYVQLCTYIVRTAMYVHCTYGPVRPKNFHSECYPYQIRMYELVRTMYVHCTYICPLGYISGGAYLNAPSFRTREVPLLSYLYLIGKTPEMAASKSVVRLLISLLSMVVMHQLGLDTRREVPEPADRRLQTRRMHFAERYGLFYYRKLGSSSYV